jgi:hypothetical protein
MPVLDKAHLNKRHEIFRVERILYPEAAELPKRDYKVIAVMPAFNAETNPAFGTTLKLDLAQFRDVA